MTRDPTPVLFEKRFELLDGETWHPGSPYAAEAPARDLEAGTEVLLALRSDRFTSPLEIEQDERLTRTLAGLDLPFVLPLTSGLDQHTHWAAFAPPAGQPLDRQDPLGPGALPLMLKICLAVGEAQARGLVLRHLRPSRVFVDASAGKVAMQVPGAPAGRYEQHDLDALRPPWGDNTDHAHLDARSDVWNLGRIFFWMVTGTTPEPSTPSGVPRVIAMMYGPLRSVSELVSGAPAALSQEIARCLERDRARRPPDAAAVGRSLLPLYGNDDELSRAIEALPPAKTEAIDWARVEGLAEERLNRARSWPRPSKQPLYDLTEARRMRAAELYRQGRHALAIEVLDRALRDDPTEELQQARGRVALR